MKSSPFFLLILILAFPIYSTVIKTGSVIDIKVQNYDDFSGRYTVDADGTIDYPLIADEPIINLTTSELMNELTFRLAKHIDNPLVIINIVKRPPILITVLGAVNNPGPVDALKGATIQEAIQLAGGALAGADLTAIKVIRNKGGDAELVNLKEFMKTGSMKNMPKLENEDIVVLLSQNKQSKVKVIGAVNKPGFYDLEEEMNIFEAIYLAGGPAEKADLSRVRRFSGQNGKEQEEILNIRSFMDKGEMDKIPKVEEGDMIIVYSKWFDWKVFMNILTNVLLFIVTIQSIRTAVGTE